MKRTASIDLDNTFEYTGQITKAYVDSKTGERHIVGVASGVEEDRDKERCSRNAIGKMVRTVGQGEVALTASHQQDWWSTIGKAVSATHDPETDEFRVDTVLPPEGEKTLADEAWKTVNSGKKIGFSIGGKLRSAYFELTDLGKKRRVLDDIALKHLCLTENPSYAPSFAQAVAKTFDGDEPGEDAFTLDGDIEKDLTTGSWVSGGGSNSGNDSKGSGERNAGTRNQKTGKPSTDDEKSSDNEDDDDDEPLTEADRHLSCPNCGHEFAAELPAEMTPGEREAAEKPDQKDSQKSTEADMDLQKTITDLEASVAKLEDPDFAKGTIGFDDLVKRLKEKGHSDEKAKAIAASIGHNKYGEKGIEEKAKEGEEKEKTTETDSPDILKIVAASHAENGERLDKIEKNLSEALTLIGGNLKTLNDKVGAIPLGRKSVARVRGKGDMAADEIGKTTEAERAADDDGSLHSALLTANRETYGIA